MAEKYTISVLYKVLDKASIPLKKVGVSLRSTQTRVRGVTGALNRVSVAGKRASMALQRTAGSMRKSFTGMPTMVKAGMGLAVTAIFKETMDFNKKMANVSTLLDGNFDTAMKRTTALKTSVQDLAVSVGIDTGEMADGLYQVVSAFGDNEETMKRLEIVSKAGAAGVATTTDALNLLSAVTKGYGDTSAAAMKKAADLAFTTVKLGQTTFPELAASIGRVVPLAAKLGISQEELFTVFSTLTGVTGNAAEVSTQYAAILRAMLKPTTDMTKASKQLGYESAAQMLKENGLVKTLNLLKTITKGNETATAKLFGRAEALTSVFALTGKQAGDYSNKMKAAKDATGKATEAFKRMQEGINKSGVEWNKTMTMMKVSAQTLGDTVAPILNTLLKDSITPFLQGIKSIFQKETYIGILDTIKFAAIEAGTALAVPSNMIPEKFKAEQEKRRGRVLKFGEKMAPVGAGGIPGMGTGVMDFKRMLEKEKSEHLVSVKVSPSKEFLASLDQVVTKKKGNSKVNAGIEGSRSGEPKTKGRPEGME